MADKRELYKMGCTAPRLKGVSKAGEVYRCPWGTLRAAGNAILQLSLSERAKREIRFVVRKKEVGSKREGRATSKHEGTAKASGRSVKFHFTLARTGTSKLDGAG